MRTDKELLNWILRHWLVDVPDSFETPLEEQKEFMVFEIQSPFLKLRPLYEDEPLRDIIDRAMEEGG